MCKYKPQEKEKKKNTERNTFPLSFFILKDPVVQSSLIATTPSHADVNVANGLF